MSTWMATMSPRDASHIASTLLLCQYFFLSIFENCLIHVIGLTNLHCILIILMLSSTSSCIHETRRNFSFTKYPRFIYIVKYYKQPTSDLRVGATMSKSQAKKIIKYRALEIATRRVRSLNTDRLQSLGKVYNELYIFALV